MNNQSVPSDEFWNQLENHYNFLGINFNSITYDGIRSPQHFSSCQKRILFVLKESNNFPKGSMLGIGMIGRWGYVMAKMAIGLVDEFPDYNVIANDKDLQNKLIASIALINVKKVTGGRHADESKLHFYASVDRDLLVEQISMINPQIIVACATYEIVTWLLNPQISPEQICKGYYWTDNRMVLRSRHPSGANHEEEYNKLKQIYFECKKANDQ